MNMQHGRLAPAAVAAVVAVGLGAPWVARYGLDADFGNDGTALVWLIAAVLLPGIAAAVFDTVHGALSTTVAVVPRSARAPALAVARAQQTLVDVGRVVAQIDLLPVTTDAALTQRRRQLRDALR